MRTWEDFAFQEMQAFVDLLLLRQKDGLPKDSGASNDSSECKGYSQIIEGLHEQ